MTRLRDIPSIPETVPDDLARPLRAMREAIQRLMGNRGAGLDAALTGRSGGIIGSGGTIIIGGGPGASGPGGDPDLTPPPTVSSLAIQAGFSEVIISWAGINYTQGHGNRQTLIYAVKKDPADPTMPLFGEAPLVAVAPHALTVIALPSELNTRWHVWAKFESNDGVLSVSPAGGTNGVQGTTAQDVTQLLEVLNQQITESQLYANLGATINLIRVLQGEVDESAASTLKALIAANLVEQRAGEAILLTQQTLTTKIEQGLLAEAQRRELLVAAIDEAMAGVVEETTVRATQTEALASQSRLLAAEVANNAAAIVEEATVRADAVSAVAQSVTELAAVVDDNAAAIAQEATVRADADGHLEAQYSLRVQLSAGGETVVGGFGLAGTYIDGQGPTITFGVRADTFFVAAPEGSAVEDPLVPFVIKTTTWDDNGVSRPAGVYIKGAFVENLVAVYATIQSLVADDITAADITAAQILAGSLRVGGYLQSTNYVAGTSGWRITAAGVIEGYSATLRGTITATAGAIGGIVINTSDLRSSNYVPGTTGFRLNADGSVEVANLWARGNIEATSLNAATGTFTGALSGASGTFSGTLTADAVNAVNTINLAGESITSAFITTMAEQLVTFLPPTPRVESASLYIESGVLSVTRGVIETFATINLRTNLDTTNARWMLIEVTPVLMTSANAVVANGRVVRTHYYQVPTADVNTFFSVTVPYVFSSLTLPGAFKVRFNVSVSCYAGNNTLQPNLQILAASGVAQLINRKV